MSATVIAKDEETWYAQLRRSRGFRDSGNEEEFVKTALEAFRLRPLRAEPLHDLARYYLGKSRGDIAIIYADAGLSLPFPEGDCLGVEEVVYHTALKEVFTIAASYSKNPEEKERGRVICNWLSLSKDVPDRVRGLARLNYNWYAEPARSIMPSMQFYPISIDTPDGFKPGNISIAREGDGFVVLIRAVNYDKLESGYFDRHGDTSFRQRTLLARLDANLQITSSIEVLAPQDMPRPQHTDSLGFEDPRPIIWRGDLWCISSVRQLNPDGRAEMVLARIAETPQGNKVLTDWRVLASGMPVQWEKNWMPQVMRDELRFIYSVGPTRILSESGDVLVQEIPSVAVENFRGGSQAVSFDGGWLMVIHEWENVRAIRHYFHRFIWFDENNRLNRISRRFFFQRIASEFVAGLAWHPTGDRLVIGFGIDDHEPTLAVVDAGDVRAALLDIDEHRKASDRACEVGQSVWEALSRQPVRPLIRSDGSVRKKELNARLFTAFGTALYVDAASGELRHGPIERSPANAVFVADPGLAEPYCRGWLMHDADLSRKPLVCRADRCHVASRSEDASGSTSPTVLELIPLERGLIAFRAGDFFLSAIPDGRIGLSASVCGTSELFLASEASYADAPDTSDEWEGDTAGAKFDKKKIESYIVDPLTRARANAKPKARKILIYGYTKWSHGRVYYDLCKNLHQRGYIVDILDWRNNHAVYIGEIIPHYDLFMTALDGVRTLVDAYGVPYDRIIALSHHEFDMRILIEQKGIEVFDKFANYGVVSEYLYSASLMRGVPRTPMVVALGITFSDFYAEIPERLATVGYAGSMSVNTFGVEWKRGELAEASARDAELEFKVAGWTGNQISFHDMPDFYRTVDAVLATSISEGAGLPVLEAAAAGRLVIGTPVGHFPLKAYQGGGILAPIESEKFKAFTSATLRYYKENPAAFVDKCRSIQEAARQFDWQYTIGEWIELIEAAEPRSRTGATT